MSSAAKGAWVVTAGVVPGMACEELGLRLGYTAEDFAIDRKRAAHDRTRFVELRDQALEYTRDLADPGRVHWVTLRFIWF